jgi:hypothetical protein
MFFVFKKGLLTAASSKTLVSRVVVGGGSGRSGSSAPTRRFICTLPPDAAAGGTVGGPSSSSKYKALPYKVFSEEFNEEDFDLLYSYLGIRGDSFVPEGGWAKEIDPDCLALRTRIFPELSDDDLLRFKKRLQDASMNYRKRERALRQKAKMVQAEEDVNRAEKRVQEAQEKLEDAIKNFRSLAEQD